MTVTIIVTVTAFAALPFKRYANDETSRQIRRHAYCLTLTTSTFTGFPTPYYWRRLKTNWSLCLPSSPFPLTWVYKGMQSKGVNYPKRRASHHSYLQHSTRSNYLAQSRKIWSREIFSRSERVSRPLRVSSFRKRSSKLHRYAIRQHGAEARAGEDFKEVQAWSGARHGDPPSRENQYHSCNWWRD